MLTIFIDKPEYDVLAEQAQDMLKETYTRGGRILSSVLGFTHMDHYALEKNDSIELNMKLYNIVHVSRIRFFGNKGESLHPVQQVFLEKD